MISPSRFITKPVALPVVVQIHHKARGAPRGGYVCIEHLKLHILPLHIIADVGDHPIGHGAHIILGTPHKNHRLSLFGRDGASQGYGRDFLLCDVVHSCQGDADDGEARLSVGRLDRRRRPDTVIEGDLHRGLVGLGAVAGEDQHLIGCDVPDHSRYLALCLDGVVEPVRRLRDSGHGHDGAGIGSRIARGDHADDLPVQIHHKARGAPRGGGSLVSSVDSSVSSSLGREIWVSGG